MCGVIVVDTGRSRSTNLGRDAYILIIALDVVIIIRSSINCPTVICLPTVCYFLREATNEIYYPRVYSLSCFLSDLLFSTFIFRSIIPKPKHTLLHFLFASFIPRFIEIYLSNISQFLSRQLPNFWHRYPKGIEDPINTSGCKYFFFESLV